MRKKYCRLIFSWSELNWVVLGAHLKISYWIWLWYIKIDRFHGLSIKWGQKWKKSYELTFGSDEPFWELISKRYKKCIVWHIKIDSLTALWIKWGQNEEKILPAHFQLIRAQLSRFGSSFLNFIFRVGCNLSKLIVFMDY